MQLEGQGLSRLTAVPKNLLMEMLQLEVPDGTMMKMAVSGIHFEL